MPRMRPAAALPGTAPLEAREDRVAASPRKERRRGARALSAPVVSLFLQTGTPTLGSCRLGLTFWDSCLLGDSSMCVILSALFGGFGGFGPCSCLLRAASRNHPLPTYLSVYLSTYDTIV